jgi:hypothetical protein
MAIFDRLTKGKNSVSSYFTQNKETAGEGKQGDSLPSHLLRSGKKIDNGLFVELLRVLKSHDLKASIGVFSNTKDNFKKDAALMINKGVVSKKIVAYLQDMRLQHIEKALTYVQTAEPDTDGFFMLDDRLAGNFNLPADVVVFPVFSGSRANLGLILVATKNIGNRSQLAGKIRKIIK